MLISWSNWFGHTLPLQAEDDTHSLMALSALPDAVRMGVLVLRIARAGTELSSIKVLTGMHQLAGARSHMSLQWCHRWLKVVLLVSHSG